MGASLHYCHCGQAFDSQKEVQMHLLTCKKTESLCSIKNCGRTATIKPQYQSKYYQPRNQSKYHQPRFCSHHDPQNQSKYYQPRNQKNRDKNQQCQRNHEQIQRNHEQIERHYEQYQRNYERYQRHYEQHRPKYEYKHWTPMQVAGWVASLPKPLCFQAHEFYTRGINGQMMEQTWKFPKYNREVRQILDIWNKTPYTPYFMSKKR